MLLGRRLTVCIAAGKLLPSYFPYCRSPVEPKDFGRSWL